MDPIYQEQINALIQKVNNQLQLITDWQSMDIRAINLAINSIEAEIGSLKIYMFHSQTRALIQNGQKD